MFRHPTDVKTVDSSTVSRTGPTRTNPNDTDVSKESVSTYQSEYTDYRLTDNWPHCSRCTELIKSSDLTRTSVSPSFVLVFISVRSGGLQIVSWSGHNEDGVRKPVSFSVLVGFKFPPLCLKCWNPLLVPTM